MGINFKEVKMVPGRDAEIYKFPSQSLRIKIIKLLSKSELLNVKSNSSKTLPG